MESELRNVRHEPFRSSTAVQGDVAASDGLRDSDDGANEAQRSQAGTQGSKSKRRRLNTEAGATRESPDGELTTLDHGSLAM